LYAHPGHKHSPFLHWMAYPPDLPISKSEGFGDGLGARYSFLLSFLRNEYQVSIIYSFPRFLSPPQKLLIGARAEGKPPAMREEYSFLFRYEERLTGPTSSRHRLCEWQESLTLAEARLSWPQASISHIEPLKARCSLQPPLVPVRGASVVSAPRLAEAASSRHQPFQWHEPLKSVEGYLRRPYNAEALTGGALFLLCSSKDSTAKTQREDKIEIGGSSAGQSLI
jgi:hypothetical protein